MTPLKLSDSAWSAVRELAVPIPVHLRSAYLDAVSSALAGVHDPDDGDIHRAACAAQKIFLHGPRSSDEPVFDGTTGLPLTPRQHAEAMGIKQTNGGDIGVTIVGARPK
jgi:hypothetical protein